MTGRIRRSSGDDTVALKELLDGAEVYALDMIRAGEAGVVMAKTAIGNIMLPVQASEDVTRSDALVVTGSVEGVRRKRNS